MSYCSPRSSFLVERFRRAGDPKSERKQKIIMHSRIPSDEEAVKAWFRDYSSGLASVGVRLGLSRTQQSELEHRLLAVCHRPGAIIATKRGLRSEALVDRLPDPIKSRWLHDHLSAQGGPWTGA